jgi:lipoprotein-anchoring transpeptidase ErfK/SrfK
MLPPAHPSKMRLLSAMLLLAAFALCPVAADGNDGVTPLMLAAAAGDVEKVSSLLGGGAAVDACDARGHTAIWHAVNARQPKVLSLLLEKARAVPERCPLGRDALRRALDLRDWALILPLLEASRTNLGWTLPARRALAAAINARQLANVKALAAHHWRDPVMEGSRHPILAHAVVSGDAQTTLFLLDAGFNSNTRVGDMPERRFMDGIKPKFIRHYLIEDRGITVLMLAAGLDRAEIAKLLIERGARPGTPTLRHKKVALTFAAKAGSVDIMRALIGDCPSPDELRIEVSLGGQTATLFRKGKAVESTEISTGVEGFDTPPGRYLVTDKHRDHVSNVYKGARMPYFMRLNCGDFGLHHGVVTGEPASHGCIRLPGAIARKWFNRVPIGTEVNIY